MCAHTTPDGGNHACGGHHTDPLIEAFAGTFTDAPDAYLREQFHKVRVALSEHFGQLDGEEAHLLPGLRFEGETGRRHRRQL